jgi:outer membrane protein OmpA-like peptidoglycan-associated protein
MSRLPIEDAPMCFFRVLMAATLLTLDLGSSAAVAQAPAGTSDATIGKVLDIQGNVLDIKGQVLDIVGLGAEAQGVASSISGQVVSLGAAIQNLKGAGTGVVVTETPRPPAPGPKAPPRREVRIYLPADVLFDFDKAELRAEAAPVLERVATVLKSDPTASATIEGHTDGKGNDQYNQALSERRAQSVRLWLGGHGVTSSMAARGFGKTRPVAANTQPNGADNPEGRQRNRRVEVTFTTAQ